MTPPRLHHVSLRVRDAQASAAFYRAHFGFAAALELRQADHRPILHLEAPGTGVRIELIEAAGDAASADTVHLGFSCRDLDALVAAMRASGVCVASGPLRVGAERIVFFRDPDGYLIELNDGLPGGP